MTERPGFEVFPVAIGRYSDPKNTELEVDAQVRVIAELLSDFGAVEVPWGTGADERGGDAVRARLDSWATSGTPHSLLYWVGHGWSDNNLKSGLAHARSPHGDYGNVIRPEDLAAAIHKRDGAGAADEWTIVVVDACWSAVFVRLLNALVDLNRGPRHLLLIGTSGDGTTKLGRFTDNLRFILRDTFKSHPHIRLYQLAEELGSVMPQAEVVPKRVNDGVLVRLNPVVTGTTLDVAEEVSAALAALDDDERSHFLSRARGGEPDDHSWFFQGRRAEMRAAVGWLAATDTGMLVVTGRPGTGKSALLGQLLVRSKASLHDLLRRHGLVEECPHDELPGDNAFDLAVHLTGMSTFDLASEIAESMGLEPPHPAGTAHRVGWLLARVSERAPLTLLLDALDEAVDPITMAEILIRQLAAVPGVRVVVGTRRSTHEGPDLPVAEDQNIIDALHDGSATTITVARDARAITRYVSRRLNAAVQDGRLSADPLSINEASALIGASDHEFLFARLAVAEVVADSGHLDADRLDELLAGDHQALFAVALRRLAEQSSSVLPLLHALGLARGRGLPIRTGVWSAVTTALHPEIEAGGQEIGRLLRDAAPYVMVDREHGETVYRLAHRTFEEYFERDNDVRAGHERIARSLISLVQHGSSTPSPYVIHHLPGHVALGGVASWQALANHPDVLLRMNPRAIAACAMRTAFGRVPLPPMIAAVITAAHQLGVADAAEQRGVLELASARGAQLRPLPDLTGSWHVQWADLAAEPVHLTLDVGGGEVPGIIAFPAPDGRTLLAAAGRRTRIWDPLTGQSVGDPLPDELGKARAITSYVDHQRRVRLAVAAHGNMVRRWIPLTGKPDGEPLSWPDSEIHAITAIPRPSGDLLVTGHGDGGLRVWDPADDAVIQDLGDPAKSRVRTLVFLPSSNTIVAGHDNGHVRMWDAGTWTPISPSHRGHTGGVRGMALFPGDSSSESVISCAGDGVVRQWNPKTGLPLEKALSTQDVGIRSVTVFSDRLGRRVVATGDNAGMVRLWDASSGEAVGGPLRGRRSRIHAIAPVPVEGTGVLLATASSDGTVRLWDPATSTGTTSTARRGVRALATFRDATGRTLLVSGHDDGGIRVRDARTGADAGSPPRGHAGSVLAVAAFTTADGRTQIATGGIDRTMRIWDCATWESTVIGHPAPITTIAVARRADGKQVLVSGSNDGVVWLWDADSGAAMGEKSCHEGGVRAVAALTDPDGQGILVTGGNDSTVLVWHFESSGAVFAGPSPGLGKVTGMAVLAADQDRSRMVAVTTNDQAVHLWDATNPLRTSVLLSGHKGPVRAVASTRGSDGTPMVITGGKDRTVRVWTPTTGEPPRVLHIDLEPLALTTVDERTIVVGGEEGVAVIVLG